MGILFYPGLNKDNEELLMPDYPKFHRELAKKSVTITLLSLDRVLFGSQCGWQKTYMSTQINDNYHEYAILQKQRCVYSVGWRRIGGRLGQCHY